MWPRHRGERLRPRAPSIWLVFERPAPFLRHTCQGPRDEDKTRKPMSKHPTRTSTSPDFPGSGRPAGRLSHETHRQPRRSSSLARARSAPHRWLGLQQRVHTSTMPSAAQRLSACCECCFRLSRKLHRSRHPALGPTAAWRLGTSSRADPAIGNFANGVGNFDLRTESFLTVL